LNLLITGASGQLGQNITPLISTLFSNVYELSRHDKPYFDVFKLIKSDLTSHDLEEKLDAVIRNHSIDLVLHMGFFISSVCDIDDWNSNLKTNILGTHHLLNWSIKRKVKAFYFISSYLHLNTDKLPLTINSNFSPSIPYAASKLVNELEIMNLCEKSNIPYAVFRLPSFYGPMPTKVWTVLPVMIRSALLNRSIEVYGTGSRTMNFVHTNDIASAITKSFEKNATGIFHISSNHSISMRELAKLINNMIPETKIIIDRRPDPREDERLDIDISKTINQLDWKPFIDISQGITDAVLSVRKALSIK